MGFFDFLKGPDINEGMERCVATPDAVLLDVRTGAEYQEGHLPAAETSQWMRCRLSMDCRQTWAHRCLSTA